jgi:hypothetical protein
LDVVGKQGECKSFSAALFADTGSITTANTAATIELNFLFLSADSPATGANYTACMVDAGQA